MKFRIRNADRIVGIFILLALAALVVLIFFLGSNQRWFARNYHYTSVFKTGGNLSPGTGIFMKGFEIGKIESRSLNQDDQVNVVFYIYDTYADRVTESSVLEMVVSPIGLGGGLQFYRGKSTVVLPEMSQVPSMDFDEARHLVEAGVVDRPPQDDSIVRLLANANQTLEGINRTVSLLNQAIEGRGGGELKKIIDDISASTASLRTVLHDVPTLVDGLSTQLVGKDGAISNLQAAMPGILAQVDSITTDLAKTAGAFSDPTGLVTRLLDPKGSINTLLDDNNSLWNSINTLLATINQAASDLQKTTAGISNEVPRLATLLAQAKTALEQIQDVMTGLKNNPLLKDGIPDRPQQDAAIRSIRGGEF